MKRRQYLKSMTLFATGILSGNFLRYALPTQKQNCFIAIGSLSFNCFSYFWEQQVRGQYVLIADQFTIKNEIDDRENLIKIDTSDLLDPANLKTAHCTLSEQSDFLNMLNNWDRIILLTHFQSKEEFLIGTELNTTMRNHNVELEVVHFTPFNFEGKTKSNWSESFIKNIEISDLVVNLEKARKMYPNESFSSFFNKINSSVLDHLAI